MINSASQVPQSAAIVAKLGWGDNAASIISFCDLKLPTNDGSPGKKLRHSWDKYIAGNNLSECLINW